MSHKDQFNGLSHDQVRRILEQIATKANIMAEMCREQAERAGDNDFAMTFHALDSMLCSLGALADMPTGGAIVGGFGDWMLGPFFYETARKARRQRVGGAV